MPPVATARGTPGGLKLRDGFKCLITFSANPTIKLWEKTVDIGGLNLGEKIDQTTMHNSRRRTYAPRQLHEVTDTTMICAFDPAVRSQIDAIIGIPMTITRYFSDGTTWADYGWLNMFEVQTVEEGSQPEAEVQICYSSEDHAASWVESAGVIVEIAGT